VYIGDRQQTGTTGSLESVPYGIDLDPDRWLMRHMLIRAFLCGKAYASASGRIFGSKKILLEESVLCMSLVSLNGDNCHYSHTVLPNNAAEQERYYIKNVLKKPQYIRVRQFVQCVEQLNFYIV
jgi:hypothetical protein